MPTSDQFGDACDLDDDNDGILDAAEVSLDELKSICPLATATLDPLAIDTDGDRVTDGAECELGSDPANAASKPPPVAGTDTDGDGLSNGFEATIGTNPRSKTPTGTGCKTGGSTRGTEATRWLWIRIRTG